MQRKPQQEDHKKSIDAMGEAMFDYGKDCAGPALHSLSENPACYDIGKRVHNLFYKELSLPEKWDVTKEQRALRAYQKARQQEGICLFRAESGMNLSKFPECQDAESKTATAKLECYKAYGTNSK